MPENIIDDTTWLRPETAALTPMELLQERSRRVARLYEEGIIIGPGHFTCDSCNLAPRCRLAFDTYNTDKDCLLEK